MGSEFVNLGDEVEDTITGFRGIAIAITKWLHGCRRVTIQPQTLQDGKVPENATFDEPQLRVRTAGKYGGSSNTGGPRPEPQRAAVPPRR